jgi:glucose-6-phosphate 1-epimerase
LARQSSQQPPGRGHHGSSAGTVERIDFNGLEALRLTAASGAAAVVTLYGAQVLSWVTPDGKEQFFLSERARFGNGSAIRGGVPVCFPQFSSMGLLPKHGFVRTMQWDVVEAFVGGPRTIARLGVMDTPATRELWPHRFQCELHVLLEGSTLEIALSVSNFGDKPFSFTGALHSYFSVGDIARVTLAGLDGVEFRDAAHGNAIARQAAARMPIRGEVDSVFHSVLRPVVIEEGADRVSIRNVGFMDAVVWNPGAELCATLQDMKPDAYREMLCVEAAAVRDTVSLAPGQTWKGGQRISVGVSGAE